MNCRICRHEMQRAYGMFSIYNQSAEVFVCVNPGCAHEGAMRIKVPRTHEENQEKNLHDSAAEGNC